MATILLIDDDPLQAFVRMSALEKKFPSVQRVADPAEAFCMVEEPQFAGKLSLVIADTHRPGSTELVAELRLRLPSVPVLVLGSSHEDPADYAYAGEGVRFLSPPVASEEILAAASEMLSQKVHTALP
jgi:CheY-like chemotaxis protein